MTKTQQLIFLQHPKHLDILPGPPGAEPASLDCGTDFFY